MKQRSYEKLVEQEGTVQGEAGERHGRRQNIRESVRSRQGLKIREQYSCSFASDIDSVLDTGS
jgi:hypothetical protein